MARRWAGRRGYGRLPIGPRRATRPRPRRSHSRRQAASGLPRISWAADFGPPGHVSARLPPAVRLRRRCSSLLAFMSLSFVCLKTTALRARLWFCHSLEWLPPVTRPGPLREVLAVIQAGLSGSVAGHVCSFAALGCLVVEVLSPAPGRAALWSHAVCPAASSAPRGAFAYSVYPLRGLETVSRAARC